MTVAARPPLPPSQPFLRGSFPSPMLFQSFIGFCVRARAAGVGSRREAGSGPCVGGFGALLAGSALAGEFWETDDLQRHRSQPLPRPRVKASAMFSGGGGVPWDPRSGSLECGSGVRCMDLALGPPLPAPVTLHACRRSKGRLGLLARRVVDYAGGSPLGGGLRLGRTASPLPLAPTNTTHTPARCSTVHLSKLHHVAIHSTVQQPPL